MISSSSRLPDNIALLMPMFLITTNTADLHPILFHFLFFRGEKLYVTKDNRPNQPNNYGSLRKYLCWAVGLIFVVAAVTIGALIGGQFTVHHGRSYPQIYRQSPIFSYLTKKSLS